MKARITIVVSELAEMLAITETCKTLNLPYEQAALTEPEMPEVVKLGERPDAIKPEDRKLFAVAKSLLPPSGSMPRIDLVRALAERKSIDPKKAGYRVRRWLRVGALASSNGHD